MIYLRLELESLSLHFLLLRFFLRRLGRTGLLGVEVGRLEGIFKYLQLILLLKSNKGNTLRYLDSNMAISITVFWPSEMKFRR